MRSATPGRGRSSSYGEPIIHRLANASSSATTITHGERAHHCATALDSRTELQSCATTFLGFLYRKFAANISPVRERHVPPRIVALLRLQSKGESWLEHSAANG